jgi:hypothetical protein
MFSNMNTLLLVTLVITATSATTTNKRQSSISTSATDCQVQDGSLVCDVGGEQYQVTSDVDLSSPPTLYSVCEALDETTLLVLQVLSDMNNS